MVVRDAVPQPYLENLLIFDRTRSLRANLDSVEATSGFTVAAAMTGAYVTKDSDPKSEMSYQEWCSSMDPGSIADPWVIHMVNESFSIVA